MAAGDDDVAVRHKPATRGVLVVFPWPYCMRAHVTDYLCVSA